MKIPLRSVLFSTIFGLGIYSACFAGQPASPETRVTLLDAQVGLTSEQRKLAQAIYAEEYKTLLALSEDQRAIGGREARQTCKTGIQNILTSEQQQKLVAIRLAADKRDADDLRELENFIKNSRAVAARVGAIKQLRAPTASRSENAPDRSGKNVFIVTGEQRTELITVHWEKTPATAPMKIIKLEGQTGEKIQP